MTINISSPALHSYVHTHISEHLTHPKYRADIDGLRAIAVLSVVGFHAFPSWIKGGFIGVDIFFVISGFLISTIIFSNLERDSFSFVEFYSRRIKRIFPALLLIMIASFVFGWFALLTDEYMQLGKHIAGGAGFVSNFLFWNESSYFDNAAETKPMLHLWSLGIEEQFYIIWPLLLWLAWKRRFNLLLITVAIAMISFALNIGKINNDAVALFYSPQTRFWELLMGSGLAYVTLFNQSTLKKLTQRNYNLQSFCGATLLVVGILLITKEQAFPGWWALLPTVGATLIISAGSQAWLNRVVLSSRVLVWFGLISFPLYLWHWPLLSFARIWDAGALTRGTRIGAVLISILLAWLTYKLIEKPIRSGNKSNNKVFPLLVLMTLVGSIGYVIYVNEGLPGYGFRSQEKSDFANYFDNSAPKMKYFEAQEMNAKYRFDCDFYDVPKYSIGDAKQISLRQIDKSCYTRNPSKKNVLFIWGDSHAQQLYFGLNNNLPKDWQILIVASVGCVANSSVQEESINNYCQKSNWFALKTIKETKPDVVIVAQTDGHKFDELNKLGDFLLKSGVGKVVFTGPVPHWKGGLPKLVMRKLWNSTPERTFVGIDEKIMKENLYLKKQFLKSENLVFMDLMELFCNQNGCLTRIGNDRKAGITSWDYGHLTPIASDYLAKDLWVKILDGQLKPTQQQFASIHN